MTKLKTPYHIYLCLLIILVSACSTNSRYQHKNDSTPTRLPNANELHDATPRVEKPSRGGNKNYHVFGKHYQVLKNAENFSQTGTASWYGRKFHGHLTSNGEIYDMYAMSAAHKNLPLPTYLKVVNNNNGRSVIVRVNDRGPFHQSRIIDLSYSAAYKLDMLKTGTANVTVTVISDFTTNGLAQLKENSQPLDNSPAKITPLPKATTTAKTISVRNIEAKIAISSSLINLAKAQYIQVFSSRSDIQATKLARALSKQYQRNTLLERKNGIFRVIVGPIVDSKELTKLLLVIKENGHPEAFMRK
ncbi:MAG: rare lipoprotein A [Psychroserpens sp.]|jgi:rare lipoprotein A